MTVEPSALPAATCTYDHFDIQTLEPLNEDTYVRLDELGWNESEFAGRTVLDIGANSGLLTVHALRLGARSVHACEVQTELADFVRQVVHRHGLPVEVSGTPFHKLTAEEHGADVVLFMEVLHWVVSQGIPQREAVRKLAELTGELLYLETPWSVAEPSIRAQTTLTDQTYSAATILDELTKYFRDVRVVRFMHYFGFNSASTRVLVRAQGKRAEAEVLGRLADTYSLDRTLSHSRHSAYLLTSPRGPLVAKQLAPESRLIKLTPEVRAATFDALHAHGPRTMVLPERLGDDYLVMGHDGEHLMLFPFVAKVGADTAAGSQEVDQLIALLCQVRDDFRAPGVPVEELRALGLAVSVESVRGGGAAWRQYAEGVLDVAAVDRLLGVAVDEQHLDSLNHGDLQGGNLVRGADGATRVVDLDNMTVGTAYSDGLMALVWHGATAAAMRAYCDRVRASEGRDAGAEDVAVALAQTLGWFGAYMSILGHATDDPVVQQFVRGSASIVGLAADLRGR
jgi:SAM-dependent methyltransferase